MQQCQSSEEATFTLEHCKPVLTIFFLKLNFLKHYNVFLANPDKLVPVLFLIVIHFFFEILNESKARELDSYNTNQ